MSTNGKATKLCQDLEEFEYVLQKSCWKKQKFGPKTEKSFLYSVKKGMQYMATKIAENLGTDFSQQPNYTGKGHIKMKLTTGTSNLSTIVN